MLLRSYTECVRDLDKLNLITLGCGDLVLGSSYFLQLPRLASKKMMLASQVAKRDLKIIISLRLSQSLTHSVAVLETSAYIRLTFYLLVDSVQRRIEKVKLRKDEQIPFQLLAAAVILHTTFFNHLKWLFAFFIKKI